MFVSAAVKKALFFCTFFSTFDQHLAFDRASRKGTRATDRASYHDDELWRGETQSRPPQSST